MSVKWKQAAAGLGAAAVIAGAVVLGGTAAVVVGGGIGGQSHADTRAAVDVPATPPNTPWPKWSAEGRTVGTGHGHRAAVAVKPISCPPPDAAPDAQAGGAGRGTEC